MLTKDDLTAIRKIVREEVEVEHESSFSDISGDMAMFRMRMTEQINNLADRIKDLTIKIRNN